MYDYSDFDDYDAERHYMKYDEAECAECGGHPDDCAGVHEDDGDHGGEDAYLDTYMEDRISTMYIGGDW